MFRTFRAVPRWWFPSVGAAIGASLVAVILVTGEVVGPSPPQASEVPPEPLSQADGAVHLAGTGSWVPLARSLARAFEADRPDISLEVHQSIGSRGGRRAMDDGVIDIGLISHPEGQPPDMSCCDVVPIALAAVVFAVPTEVTTVSLSREEVIEIFSGQMLYWPDGEIIVPLLREEHDSSTTIAGEAIPEFIDAVREARASGRWRILITDGEMKRALVATSGAIGLFDLGVILLKDLPLHALALDGVTPNAANLAGRRYPMRRVLSLVVNPSPRPEVRAFLEFLRSPDGRVVIEGTGGYVSLSRASE